MKPEQLREAVGKAVVDEFGVPGLTANGPKGTHDCRICGLTDEPAHSCPDDRSEWNIPTIVLGPESYTGKLSTAFGDYIVQWDPDVDEGSLILLVDEGTLCVRPSAANALSISVEFDLGDD
jgi:hypothetical protein